MNNSKLNVKAILICDNVATDGQSGKNTLYGIFDNINAKQFPAIHRSLCVFVNFTEALGQYRFRLELVNVENNNPVFPGAEILDVVCPDIELHYSLVFQINELKFDVPGKYEFRLFANGQICETSTIRIKQIP